MIRKPDFKEFENYLLGRSQSSRVHPADLFIGDHILKQYTEKVLKESWVDRDSDMKEYFRNYVKCYVSMGFDYIPLHFWIQNTFTGFPKVENWIVQDKGLIYDRHSFGDFPWDELAVDYSCIDAAEEFLPENMKLVIVSGDLQDLMDVIVGMVTFLMMIHDDPGLLSEIITRWFSIKYEMFKKVLTRDSVGAIFTCADMGSGQATLFSPEFISRELIPWYKRYSEAAHEIKKMFWFHCCGDIFSHGVMDMLIDEVKIDAFHSFQDCILPVTGFLERYGKNTAALGGIDLDKLCRFEEDELRGYIRNTLEYGMKNGRLALGTGNSVADYIPLQNWLILLDEVRNYKIDSERKG